MSRRNEIKKLIAAHRRRLHILQGKQAQYGFETPPSILIEIADIESEIENLQIELEQLESETNETSVENIVGSPLQGQFVQY